MHDVVIYEEDPLTRALLQEWLQEAGYRTRFGSRGGAADGAAVELVVLSIRSPKERGCECVKSVRAAHPGKPIIAISGQFRLGVPAEGAAARTVGVERVMAKPLVRADLLQAVDALVGRPRRRATAD